MSWSCMVNLILQSEELSYGFIGLQSRWSSSKMHTISWSSSQHLPLSLGLYSKIVLYLHDLQYELAFMLVVKRYYWELFSRKSTYLRMKPRYSQYRICCKHITSLPPAPVSQGPCLRKAASQNAPGSPPTPSTHTSIQSGTDVYCTWVGSPHPSLNFSACETCHMDSSED